MVYASEHASLATLELLVHVGRSSVLPAYVLFQCSFDDVLVSMLDRAYLPPDWRRYPAPAVLQTIGVDWLRGSRSAVLAVPSAILEMELNYLLNPAHPDFERIAISPPRPLGLDARLARSM